MDKFQHGPAHSFHKFMAGKTPKNKRTDALIQYADVLPTFMDIAGAKDFSKYGGKSLKMYLLEKQKLTGNMFMAYTITHQKGHLFPIRSISNGKFRYIMNLKHENQFIEKHLMGIKGTGELNNKYWLMDLGVYIQS